MRVLVIGSGGREHALAWKLAASKQVERVFAAPGNPGMADVAECVAIGSDALEELAVWAEGHRIDLTVVGPEAPLCAGIADRFRDEELAVIGPDWASARLEGSKAFAKAFMARYGIPTAAAVQFDSVEPALEHVLRQGVPIVIKADGLAAGKGVTVAATLPEAEAAIRDCLERDRFGEAGRQVVIEECLCGQEASVLALVDGTTVVGLLPAQDHKPIGDGDRGPNTGGMGAYAPTPIIDAALRARIDREVLQPALRGIQEEGWDYRGVLYAGLMLTPEGPKVLEFNCRFGDPETQAILPALETDFAELLWACHNGELDRVQLRWHDATVVTVVLAAEGYPGSYRKGDRIEGLETVREMQNTVVFHAGTGRGPDRHWCTAGGRVLGVTSWDRDLVAARARVYRAVSAISFRGMQWRSDIGVRALGSPEPGDTGMQR